MHVTTFLKFYLEEFPGQARQKWRTEARQTKCNWGKNINKRLRSFRIESVAVNRIKSYARLLFCFFFIFWIYAYLARKGKSSWHGKVLAFSLCSTQNIVLVYIFGKLRLWKRITVWAHRREAMNWGHNTRPKKPDKIYHAHLALRTRRGRVPSQLPPIEFLDWEGQKTKIYSCKSQQWSLPGTNCL